MKLVLALLILAGALRADQDCACSPADVAKPSKACEKQIRADVFPEPLDKDITPTARPDFKLIALFEAKDLDHRTAAVMAFGTKGNWGVGLLRWVRVMGAEVGSWEWHWNFQQDFHIQEVLGQRRLIRRAMVEAQGDTHTSHQEDQ